MYVYSRITYIHTCNRRCTWMSCMNVIWMSCTSTSMYVCMCGMYVVWLNRMCMYIHTFIPSGRYIHTSTTRSTYIHVRCQRNWWFDYYISYVFKICIFYNIQVFLRDTCMCTCIRVPYPVHVMYVWPVCHVKLHVCM